MIALLEPVNTIINLVLTPSNNIDWVSKSVINSELLEELELKPFSQVEVFNPITNLLGCELALSLDEKVHRLVISGVNYTILNKF